MNCLYCKKPVPEKAAACPQCGKNVAEMKAELERREARELFNELFASARKQAPATSSVNKPQTGPSAAELHELEKRAAAAKKAQAQAEGRAKFKQTLSPSIIIPAFLLVAFLVWAVGFTGTAWPDWLLPVVIIALPVLAIVITFDYIRYTKI